MRQINYSLNVNPYGPPKSFKKVINQSYKYLADNVDYNYTAAKSALANLHGVKIENILISSGPAEILHIALDTLKIRKVLIPTPSALLYQQACKKHGCKVIPFFLDKNDEFVIVGQKLISSMDDVDLVIISNPNNPTSQIIDKTQMSIILDYCQHKGIYLIIDESYADFVSADISSVKLVERFANVIILRSLADYFALRGLGFSYCVCSQSLSGLMQSNQIPGMVNQLALHGFETLLSDYKYIKKTKAWLLSEPKRFYKKISMLGGVIAYNPYANYIFIELEQIPSATLCDRLEAKGVKVCNCNNRGIIDGQYIRISIKDKRSNDKFLDIFSGCLL